MKRWNPSSPAAPAAAEHRPEEIVRARRRYAAACAGSGALFAAGVAGCLLRPTVWTPALAPLLGALAAAFLWCEGMRLFLRRSARLPAGDLRRALRRALAAPVWMASTALLSLLPSQTAEEDAALAQSLAVLLTALLLAAVPAAVALGALSVHSAVRHLRAAPASESTVYREGPLVLASLLLAAELAALGWLAFYLLL